MESTAQSATCLRLLMFALSVACVLGDFVEPLQPETSLRSLAESQTRLPCHYQAAEGEEVVQVTWYKELPDGSKDQIITAHFTDGYTGGVVMPRRYSGRVKFESSSPTENAALLIPSTEESDEGNYTCHISTFPNGDFERTIALTVWILPITSMEPVILVEGQSYQVVASCRAAGRPVPSLSWDTELPGQAQTRFSGGGSVSTYYSLHPLRSMNGKKLDCLVSHPALEQPRRISNQLVVQYPPNATISSPWDIWEYVYEDTENFELVCDSEGNPKPQNVTWTWEGGALPDGVTVAGKKLVFGRPIRMNDSGVYECEVKNILGVGKSDFTLTVEVMYVCSLPFPYERTGYIGTAVAVVLIVVVVLVVLVKCHRNKKLSTKTQEIMSLSRQASFSRLNSVSSDPRGQGDYYTLRVDSRMKHSQISLDSGFSLSLMKAQQDDAGEQDEVDQRKEDSPHVEDWDPTHRTEEGYESGDCSLSSYRI